jgi:hypothetical protein
LCSSGGGQRLCFAEGKVESRSPQGEKHEEDRSQNRINNAAAFGFRSIFRSGRYRTSPDVLSTTLSRAISSRLGIPLKSLSENQKNSPQGEKHEKDDCQNYRDYVSAARVRYGPGSGRQRTYARVLSEAVPR